MKQISRRNFLKAAGLSVATASMAACGKEAAPSSSSVAASVAEDGREMVGNIYVEGMPIAKEPVTYKIMNTKWSSTDKSKSQNEKEIMKLSTEGTNVSIEWTETSETAYPDAFKMVMATGDGLPDGFFSTLPTENEISENPEDFFAIDEETMKTYAPNIYAQFEEHVEGGINAIKKSDGFIYTLPCGVWSEYANWSTAVPFIRIDWLKKIGKEMPTTIDELYEVLVAFKEGDMMGDGSEVIPCIFAQEYWCSKIQYIAGSWGIAGRNLLPEAWIGRVEDGEYKMNITDQRFRDFLTEMHKWHAAGLINIDGFSMSSAEYTTLANGQNFGLYANWTPPVDEWKEGKWAALPVIPAAGYEGKALKPGERNFISANKNTFSISSACKDPLGLLRWWDNCHSSAEMKRIGRDGPEGMAWEYGEDGVAYVKAVDPLPAECATDTEYHNTYAWRAQSPILFEGESAIPNPEIVTEDAIRYSLVPLYQDYFSKELIPTTPVPADKAADFSFAKAEIETAVENYMATAVFDGVTDDNWNAFVATVEASGAAEWVQFYQNYVDNSWD